MKKTITWNKWSETKPEFNDIFFIIDTHFEYLNHNNIMQMYSLDREVIVVHSLGLTRYEHDESDILYWIYLKDLYEN